MKIPTKREKNEMVFFRISILIRKIKLDNKIPKKKDQSPTDSFLISHSKIHENKSILVIIPDISIKRNFPLILFQTNFIPFVFISIIVFHEMEFMLFSSFSYIPVINATVPPEIPGMMSAAPISIPLMNIAKYCILVFLGTEVLI